MVKKSLIEEWLNKADEDLGFASSVLEGSPYYAQICFHYQQAAEKYLKTFIVANELDFKKIHDLVILLKDCRSKEPQLSEIEDECNFLSRFYIDTRYPAHWPAEYTKQDALEAKEAAEKIGASIRKILEEGGHV